MFNKKQNWALRKLERKTKQQSPWYLVHLLKTKKKERKNKIIDNSGYIEFGNLTLAGYGNSSPLSTTVGATLFCD